MNTRKSIFIIAASVGLALAAQGSLAAEGTHLVTRSQLNKLPSDCKAEEVTRILGTPESVTRWMDGSRSLVYEMSTHYDQLQHVYVDLGRDNKMTDIQIIER
jgi:hypothetical protein